MMQGERKSCCLDNEQQSSTSNKNVRYLFLPASYNNR